MLFDSVCTELLFGYQIMLALTIIDEKPEVRIDNNRLQPREGSRTALSCKVSSLQGALVTACQTSAAVYDVYRLSTAPGWRVVARAARRELCAAFLKASLGLSQGSMEETDSSCTVLFEQLSSITACQSGAAVCDVYG